MRRNGDIMMSLSKTMGTMGKCGPPRNQTKYIVADSASLLTLFHVCFDLIAISRFIIIQNTRIFCGKLLDNNTVV